MLDHHFLTLYHSQGHICSYLRSIIPIYIEVNLIMITSLLKTADVTANLAACSMARNRFISQLPMDTTEKAFPHWLHWYGFSPVCILIWIIRRLFLEKALLHWWHWYGFSPVCVLSCFVRSAFCEKALSHWYGLSSVCNFIWIVRESFREKALSHWLHLYGFSPVCNLIWVIRFCFTEKVLSHWF